MRKRTRALVAGVSCVGVLLTAPPARAQDLTPRAYVVTPLRSNALLVTDIFNNGDINFEGTAPIEDATGTINGVAAGYYRSLGILGRSANVNVVLPYGTGTFDAIVLGAPFSTHRAGLFDIPVRFAVNLLGGPAMEPGSTIRRSSSTWARTVGRSSPSWDSPSATATGSSTRMARAGSSRRTRSSSPTTSTSRERARRRRPRSGSPSCT